MACPESVTFNFRLLPVKASYYFTLAGVASLLPFLAVYMKHVGLSPSETALIYGTMPFLGAIVRPFIGALADKFHKHKAVLMAACVLTGIFYACLMAVPGNHSESQSPLVQLTCTNHQSQMRYCKPATFRQDCDPALLNRTSHTYDPFLNSSSCVLQCDLTLANQTLDICLANADSDCAKFLIEGQDANITQFDLKLDTLTHSWSQYTLSGDQAAMCHYYALTTFVFDNSSYELYCAEPSTIDCMVKCDVTDVANQHPCSQDKKNHYSRTFWMFFVLMLIANIAFSPIFTLIDAITYDFLGEDRGKWGKQRLWGTVGFAIHGLASGIIMDHYSQVNIGGNDYLPAFVMFAVLEVMAALVVCQYRISSNVACGGMLSHISTILRRTDILALFFVIFMFGAFTGVIETFLYWYLSQLDATRLLFGLCMFFNCVPEILIFFLAGFMMEKIGQVQCLYVVCIAYVIRFLAYSFLKNAWVVLAIEPLHSITFGLMYAAASSYGSMITPPGMHGTVQGIIGGLHFGFGKGCGSILGGLIYEVYGAVVLFRGCAVAAAVVFIFYFLVQQLLSCKTTDVTTPSDKEHELGALEEQDRMLPSNGVHGNNSAAPTKPDEENHVA